MSQFARTISPAAASSTHSASLADSESASIELAPKWSVPITLALLFLSVLPDAMVVPVLPELFVGRYGVSTAVAHWFMAVNMLGALAVLPVLVIARRRLTPAMLLTGAAIANAALLALMALPIGFAGTVGVRFVEGAADLLVFAVLFDLLGKAGTAGTRGRRMGVAGTVLMFALAAGMILGGRIGSTQAEIVFLGGAAACILVALVALTCSTSLNSLVRSCPVISDTGGVVTTGAGRLWPALAMSMTDRAMGGLMIVTMPFYFAVIWSIDPGTRGTLIGVMLAMMALGAWPAGRLGDRIGHVPLRTTAALTYAGLIALLPILSGASGATLVAVMALIGLSGSALFPTSMWLAGASGRGSVAMGTHRACGDIGYFLGIVIASAVIGLITVASGDEAGRVTYTAIIVAFAAAHALMTVTTHLAQRR